MSDAIEQTPVDAPATPAAESTETPAANAGQADAPKEGSAPSKDASQPAETDKSGEEPAKVVPEKYDLKLAEDSPLDPSALERIAALAKAQGMTQEEAQVAVELQEEDVKAFIKEQKDKWHADSVADKEIGGEKLTENIALANRFFDKYGSPALKTYLERTGLGSHPEVVRLFVRLGAEDGNDKFVQPGSTVVSDTRSVADKFYGPGTEVKGMEMGQ